jgi:hypothetical protein
MAADTPIDIADAPFAILLIADYFRHCFAISPLMILMIFRRL